MEIGRMRVEVCTIACYEMADIRYSRRKDFGESDWRSEI
jgi:hypothetical protein